MKKPQSQQGSLLEAWALAVLGGVIFLIIALGYFFYGLQPTMASDSEIELKIERGESFRNIGAELSQKRLIKSISVFKTYAILTGNADKFKPGIYNLSTGMSVPDLVAKLTKGGKTEMSVTIPEGITIKDVDRLLANSEVIERGSLSNYQITQDLREKYPFLENVTSLEGFLFPDTYRFHLNSSTEEVLIRFLENFKEKGWSNIKNRKNWYDILILASFLEREVKSLEDRRVVSGILLKRLDAGMPLQVDATISYVKCNKAFLGCENIQIAKSDTEMSSPYNTYERLGWTPTPISNPGESAIQAASNPIYTDYWYYLSSRESGETIYSKTLREHNINRSKHL